MRYVIAPGDCLSVLKTLDAGTVQCCVTSPPYWGLRDYGTAQWEGGRADCDHQKKDPTLAARKSTLGPARDGLGADNQAHNSGSAFKGRCGKCGARRIDSQIGLEETPDEYVAKMVRVFREVRRVLRDDGTLWLNLGDSYANASSSSSSPQRYFNGQGAVYERGGAPSARRNVGAKSFGVPEGLKPKDLVGIPWRVAFALQADGWYLRSDIVWCLSGGTRVYARTKKGDAPTTIKDLVRLRPEDVQLWNGEKWTQVLGWSKTPRKGDEIELELRSGERIACTRSHVWPTERGNVRADELRVGDVIKTCTLPEPEQPRAPAALDDEMVGWFVGLYLAEGSRDPSGSIQIASHVKERARYERLQKLAAAFDGTCNVHPGSENGCTINLHGAMLNAIIDMHIGGRIAKDKFLKPRCWKRSNRFLRAVLDGYLSGDGHYDAENGRWRIGFCRNYALEASMRTLCARLGVQLRLKLSTTTMGDREFPSFRGEIRFERSEHGNAKDDGEIMRIGAARAREFWDIGVEDEPHLFALASGVLTHNCKPNPMPESVTDRPTKAHEYLFLFAKSENYYYDADAVREPSRYPDDDRKARALISHKSMPTAVIAGIRPGSATYPYRNRRTVWTVASRPFRGAHFATMPPKLVEPCILAGSRPHDIVLDPFNGAATVGLVALQHERRYLGIELNPEYIEMSHKRLRGETIEPASVQLKKSVPQPLPLSYIFGQVKHGRRRAA